MKIVKAEAHQGTIKVHSWPKCQILIFLYFAGVDLQLATALLTDVVSKS